MNFSVTVGPDPDPMEMVVCERFIRECGISAMMDDDDRILPLPALDWKKHKNILHTLNSLEQRLTSRESATDKEKDATFDIKLSTLQTEHLLHTMEVCDYMDHQRGLWSAARIMSRKLAGKSRKEMLQILHIDSDIKDDHVIWQIEHSVSWYLPNNSIACWDSIT